MNSVPLALLAGPALLVHSRLLNEDVERDGVSVRSDCDEPNVFRRRGVMSRDDDGLRRSDSSG